MKIKIDKSFPDEVRLLLYDARKEESLLKKVEDVMSQLKDTTKRYARLGIAKRELLRGIKLARKIQKKYSEGKVETNISDYQTRLRNGLLLATWIYENPGSRAVVIEEK